MLATLTPLLRRPRGELLGDLRRRAPSRAWRSRQVQRPPPILWTRASCPDVQVLALGAVVRGCSASIISGSAAGPGRGAGWRESLSQPRSNAAATCRDDATYLMVKLSCCDSRGHPVPS
jgi:hypothetical protein